VIESRRPWLRSARCEALEDIAHRLLRDVSIMARVFTVCLDSETHSRTATVTLHQVDRPTELSELPPGSARTAEEPGHRGQGHVTKLLTVAATPAGQKPSFSCVTARPPPELGPTILSFLVTRRRSVFLRLMRRSWVRIPSRARYLPPQTLQLRTSHSGAASVPTVHLGDTSTARRPATDSQGLPPRGHRTRPLGAVMVTHLRPAS
jgi:hypothetical protein